jgi:hypothetical protein
MSDGNIHHLPGRRKPRSSADEIREIIDLSLTAHFREQNDILREMNGRLTETNGKLIEKVQQLAIGVQRLVNEMDGVRSGDKDEAFARVAATDACADLPTIQADVANIYSLTSTKIGATLGFGHHQIGHLLGPTGLKWAGDGDYQETTRWEEGHPRYWHTDVPNKLREILTKTTPADHNIKNRMVIAMFKQWKDRMATEVLASKKNVDK